MNPRFPSFLRPSGLAPGRRSGFTLMELLVVITIMMALAAVSLPVLGAVMRDVRLGAAVSRLKAGLQQTRAILTDYTFADRSNTSPAIPGAVYTGTALVLRWDDVRQDYEIFYAISNQSAVGTAGPTDWLASRTPVLRGYVPFTTLEPMTLGSGLRLAGLRRNDATATKLELVPSPSNSFAVCMDATGVGIPPAPAIYVNLQQAPERGGAGPWNTWDPAMYDGAGANTGAYAGTYGINGGTGEGFLTSLPMLIVYRDEDLPLSGNSPSGVAWRVSNPANPGSLMVNPALPPNDLLAKTRGRIVMLTMQGGSPAEY
jgi:prepilin-type N-terminal cleavage/methylation domain-containing protein